MLRRNIDVNVGLVNGAIGTVMGIYATRISIKFDDIDVPCDIERVTSRFMLSKNLYIHSKQFPLILSYAITIHKCQGLSLDTAIIDLSTDVVGDVSNLCKNEINRLRSKFRKDLPQIKKSKGKKRKIQVTGIIDDGEPCNLKTNFNLKGDDSCSSVIVFIKLSNIKCKPKDDKTKCVVKNDHCSSSLIVSIKLSSIKLKTSNPKKDDDVIFTYEEPPNPDIVRRRQWDYVYYPGNEKFQRRWCEILNLKFVTAARILPGSPTTPLSDERVPNSTLDVPGDGNCLFYALSYIITGSISQDYELRRAIISNMPNFEEELFNSTLSATRYSSIYDYINKSKMFKNYVWATDRDYYTNSIIRYNHIFILTHSYFCWLG
uniref:OTU domain-containing protein n=1 Tax=Amphimedon queenslandica TaxID=400682 RepID=A0A1X7TXS6_AMPQE